MPNLSLSRNNWLIKFLLKPLLLLSIVFSLIAGIYLANYLKIKQISRPKLISDSIINDLYDQNLFLLNIDKLKKSLLDSNPHIKTIYIHKIYPNKLDIKATLEKPFIQLFNNKEFLILNKQGKILSNKPKATKSLKVIYFYQILRKYEIKNGQQIQNQDILYCLRLNQELNRVPIQFNRLIVKKPNTVLLPNQDGTLEIVLNTKKPIDKNIIILQNIIKSVNVKGLRPKIINLEFDKPIITL